MALMPGLSAPAGQRQLLPGIPYRWAQSGGTQWPLVAVTFFGLGRTSVRSRETGAWLGWPSVGKVFGRRLLSHLQPHELDQHPGQKAVHPVEPGEQNRLQLPLNPLHHRPDDEPVLGGRLDLATPRDRPFPSGIKVSQVWNGAAFQQAPAGLAEELDHGVIELALVGEREDENPISIGYRTTPKERRSSSLGSPQAHRTNR